MSEAEILKQALRFIESVAQTCESWAVESVNGGWSTHQVDRNRELAEAAREFLARTRKEGGG